MIRPPVCFVVARVSKHCGICAPDVLRGQGRGRQSVTDAKHLAIWIVRENGGMSYPMIAAAFGLGDHTSAMHACRKIERLMREDPEFRVETASLRQEIKNAWATVSPTPEPEPQVITPPARVQRSFRDRFPPKPIADHRHETKLRQCLKCGEGFESTHAGNRICTGCRKNNIKDQPGMEIFL